MRKILAALMLMSITGCALLSSNTTVQLAVQAAIDAGIGVVLAKAPGEGPAISAAATALEQLASGSTTTVATLINDADNTIARLPGLNAPEKAALESVVTLAASEITAGQSKLSPTTSFDLALVFGDIANAANLYSSTSAHAATMGIK